MKDMMSGQDIEALLDELDGIDSSPLRPWVSSKEDREISPQSSPQSKTAPCNPSPIASLDRNSSDSFSRRPTLISHGDVEDEIDGLIGDLGRLEAKSEDDPLNTTIARRITGEKILAGFETRFSGAPRIPTRLCPERVTIGCAEEQGSRPTMEDKTILIPRFHPRYLDSCLRGPRALCGVFDGHNGRQVADFAGAKLPALLQDEAWYSSPGPPSEEAVRRSIEKAFETVDSEALSAAARGEVIGGCTANVAMVLEDVIYVANLGDARCVLCRGGKAVPLSVDHKPDMPQERSRIEALGGRVEMRGCWRVMISPPAGPARGLAVSRAVGDIDWKQPVPVVSAVPDVTWDRLRPEDEFAIVACDGVWDVLSDQDAVDLARPLLLIPSDEAAESAARTVARAALVRGSMDNVSVIILRLHW